MYKPLKCFTYLSVPPLLIGMGIGLRFLYLIAIGEGYGHVQSLILACTLIIIGFLTFMIGLVSDLMASNRRILADTQYHVRRMEYEAIEERKKKAMQSISRTLEHHSYEAVQNLSAKEAVALGMQIEKQTRSGRNSITRC